VARQATQAAPTISTHVLDTERGVAAVGIHVTLYRIADDGRALRLTQALTDGDGRVRDLLERPLTVGEYRLEFDLRRATDPSPDGDGAAVADPFFQRLSLDLRVTDPGRSHHVPSLLAPYSMTTYRGT
jgi:5-hydroxyisourate hydrolase